MRGFTAAVSLLVTLGAGCDSRTEAFEAVTARMGGFNGVVLQGPGLVLQGPGLVLQGPGLVLQGPGLVLQGPGLVLQGPGLVLQGVEFNGPGLVLQGPGLVLQGPGLVLQGSSFAGTFLRDGVEYTAEGLDFIGAEFELRLTAIVDGVQMVETVILRINDIQASAEQADVFLYDLTYRTQGSEQWLPYCGDSQVAAVPLQHYWDPETGDRIDDPNVVTFGCSNAVLAKCALWGYRPWATAMSCDKDPKKDPPKDKWINKHCSEISLQDHHQACTRMARADYCGDGTSATVNGTSIDIWDKLSPPKQTRFTDWPVEAEWDADGAVCLNFMRHPEFAYPGCFTKKNGDAKTKEKCGSLKNHKSLLLSGFSEEGYEE
ncbi:MAG: hypothetical protein IPK80_15265 [Nannocystis sp.]|nr:hypothetical protein [Nannocystis sp.]